MASLIYLNSKLTDAIYILTVDAGDARTRLAKILPKITILSTSSFPIELQKDFDWVKLTIKRGAGEIPSGFPPPYKLTGITNPTASKVIKKILDIQEKIELMIEQDL